MHKVCQIFKILIKSKYFNAQSYTAYLFEYTYIKQKNMVFHRGVSIPIIMQVYFLYNLARRMYENSVTLWNAWFALRSHIKAFQFRHKAISLKEFLSQLLLIQNTLTSQVMLVKTIQNVCMSIHFVALMSFPLNSYLQV